MRTWLLVIFGMIFSGLIVATFIYNQKLPPKTEVSPSSSPSVAAMSSAPPSAFPTGGLSPVPDPSASTVASNVNNSQLANPPLGTSIGVSPSGVPSPSQAVSNPNPDLSVDSNGLSKATVTITTEAGVIKFKFYPNDAPKTVKRIVELINKGFYNGLTFHRVERGFVIQGGDPVGNGTGGSGQKIEAEFNNRRHIEGTVAMARAAEPNSADSQFYICLGTIPYLDHNYTIFGQVIEGMDVTKKIKKGDKMTNVIVQ